jgi:hypothetical protein
VKKSLLICFILAAFAVFASSAFAQEKKAEPASPAVPKAAPAPAAPAPKATPAPAKAKAPKEMKAAGTVGIYEAGKMITVKGEKDKEWTFDITAKTKVKGEVKGGAKVTVMYVKDGEKLTATSISGPQPKKEKPAKEKPAAEKQAAPKAQ